jgi:hypothetical protein
MPFGMTAQAEDGMQQLQTRELIVALATALALGAAAHAAASGVSSAALSRYLVRPAGAVAQGSIAAGNRLVSSCADDGSAGTLRTVIASAFSGDTIDLSGLPAADPGCVGSTITLTQGGLSITTDLILKGPAHTELSIAGAGSGQIIVSSSLLQIENLTIRHGRGSIKGGCIAALAGLELQHSTVTDCIATGSSKYALGSALGGAIYATTVSMTDGSRVENSLAQGVHSPGNYKYIGFGGGVFAKTQFSCTDSTISGNDATQLGGGVFAYGSPSLTHCTVDTNKHAGIAVPSGAGQITVVESTISGNSPAGFFVQKPLSITASTVAFNYSSGPGAAGVYGTANVAAQSSIIAANTSVGSTHADLQLGGGAMLTGADNLIVSTDVSAGAGVITVTVDPNLQPLADNGGPTRTHALVADSPAIDKGNNSAVFLTDQRGDGFAREVPIGSPDIGAFEFGGDGIFADGFD